MTFDEIYGVLRERRCLCVSRMRKLYAAAMAASALPGEFWECGTYMGGSARLLAEVLRDSPRPLRLFDTFCGFANIEAKDRPKEQTHLMAGAMSYTNVEDVRQFVAADFVTIYPGAIPSRFSGLEDSQIAFANIDVDLYQPTRDSLLFILPRMMRGGAIIIDDCGSPMFPGVEIAVQEVAGPDGFQKTSSMHPDYGHLVWQGKIQL